MSTEQLKTKYLSLKKEVEEVRTFKSMSNIKRYWTLQLEKYKVYQAYKNALTRQVEANHLSDKDP